MMSAQKHQPTWAEIVKGKTAIAAPVEQKFQFDPEVAEFKPNVNQCLNPSAKEFDPSQSQLMQRAAEMTSLLLECYSDSEDDEPEPRVVATPVAASNPLACPHLNPFAKVFSPPAVHICEKPAKGFRMNTINLSYCSSDSEDESPHPSPRTATAPARTLVSRDVNSPPVAGFRPPPGLTLPDAVALNLDCYSSDDETPRPLLRVNAAHKRIAKSTRDFAEDSDSTSAGRSSDSDIECL